MTCDYCRSWNADDDHRCRRCGRRLTGSLGDSTAGYQIPRTAGNLAAAPVPVSHVPDSTAESHTAAATASPQGSLFPRRPVSNVIPFKPPVNDHAPARIEPVAAPGVQPAARAPLPRTQTKRATATSKVAPKSELQASLDLLPPAPPAPRILSTTVEASIFCEAPVATPIHRAVASALDCSIVLIGFGLFLLAFRLCGGEFVLNRGTVPEFLAAFVLIALFYGVLWVLTKSETAGMSWVHLRLINFDGFPVDGTQRALRCFGSCLSFATGGLGLLWALVDEESLTWQDHISKTFPTIRESDTTFFRRR